MAQTAKRELGSGIGGKVGQVAEEVTSAIPVQARKVTTADIMKWEKEGGHIVQNHGPQLTRDKLKERVLKQERNIPNPANRPRIDGQVPKDFRVWSGKDAMGASRWESDETMQRAIGDFINRHLEEIRAATKNGQEFTRARYRVGRKTGEGWVTTAETKAESAMLYKEDLDGMTIVIRPRRNYVPTKDDPEGWYVHTAYPDSGMN
jgi:hypothetical protein